MPIEGEDRTEPEKERPSDSDWRICFDLPLVRISLDIAISAGPKVSLPDNRIEYCCADVPVKKHLAINLIDYLQPRIGMIKFYVLSRHSHFVLISSLWFFVGALLLYFTYSDLIICWFPNFFLYRWSSSYHAGVRSGWRVGSLDSQENFFHFL
jgi:hypothetical protein